MKVRLAFSVAAHLEPEILVVDEVLAVGDADFQRRCLGKMSEVSRSGRTVLFVSHNLSAVKRLCDRAYLLDGGTVAYEGPSSDVVAVYLRDAGTEQRGGVAVVAENAERVGTHDVSLRRVSLLDADGQPIDRVSLDTRFAIAMEFDVTSALDEAVVEVGLTSAEGGRVATALSMDGGRPPLRLLPGRHEVVVDLDVTLLPGDFGVDVGMHRVEGLTLDYVTEALTFTAVNASERGHDFWPWPEVRGRVRPGSNWSFSGPLQPLEPAAGARPSLPE